MKTLKHIIFILACFTSACTTNKSSEQDLPTNKLTSTLDSIGQSILDKGEILGFSIAIDSAGKSIYQGSFGYVDAAKTMPVTEQTRFDIASVSKLIGVCVIMKLKEQGKLNMEQTLDELLPEFPERGLARKINLRHLLSHTSGLPDYAAEIDSVFMATGIVPTKHDFFSFFRAKNLHFEPGSNYQYCNSGFMMMAFIAENITGRSWQQLIDEVINEPTGLDVQLIKHAAGLPEMSPIFDLKGNEFEKVPTWVYVIGDGGLTATSRTLSKFPYYWANGNIIQQSSYQEMTVVQHLNDLTTTGYGYGVRNGEFLGEPIIGHTGGWKTTYAVLSYFPEQNLTFAGLMNTDGTDASMSRIFAEFMSAVLDKSVPDYKSGGVQEKELTKYTGQYHGYVSEFDTIGSTVSIDLEKDGKLYYCLDEFCEPMYNIKDHKFWIESYPYDFIEFTTDDEGKVAALREYYYGFFQVLRKKQDN